jgi:superfamily II DNA or RNA helicase
MRQTSFKEMSDAAINCEIQVIGNRAFVTGEFPLDAVRKATSYPAEGYRFAPAYNRKIYDPITKEYRRAWDGRVHLFHNKTMSMPSGLVRTVMHELFDLNAEANIVVYDERADSAPKLAKDTGAYNLNGIQFGVGKFDYQLKAMEAALKGKQGILKLATNAGKSEIACAITKYCQLPTLFLVPGVDLLHQTRARFAARLGVPLASIGIIGDGQYAPGEWITISTVDTLHTKKDEPDTLNLMQNVWQLVFVDECHHAGSDTFFDVLELTRAYYRFGLSGTPLDRSDGADLRLIAQTGEVLYEVSNKELIARDISVPTHIEIKRIEQPLVIGSHYRNVHNQAVVKNDFLNDDIVSWVPEQLAKGLQVVVLVREIEHGKLLEKRLRATPHVVQFISGQEETQVRIDALKSFNAGEIRCLIGTSILYQGIDTPNIDVLVMADLGKSKIAVLQALGRGLRKREGKERLLVRDYANFCHKWLTKHSLKRLQMYKNEKCFTISIAA